MGRKRDIIINVRACVTFTHLFSGYVYAGLVERLRQKLEQWWFAVHSLFVVLELYSIASSPVGRFDQVLHYTVLRGRPQIVALPSPSANPWARVIFEITRSPT